MWTCVGMLGSLGGVLHIWTCVGMLGSLGGGYSICGRV